MGMEGDAIDRRGKLAFSSVFFFELFLVYYTLLHGENTSL